MGAWLLSILLMGVFSVVCGFVVYRLTRFLKKRDKNPSEMSGEFSGIAIASMSFIFIFVAMFHSCTSEDTYKETITSLLPSYFAVAAIIAIGFIAYFFISNKKREKEEAQFIQQYGMTKEEYIVAKKAKEREEHERKRQEIIEKKNSFFKSLSDQYGKCSASFSFALSSHANKVFEAHVFEDKNMIVVFNSDLFEITNTIPFQSILDFSIDVDIKRIGGNTATTTTKTSTGSMVKRGFVGGVLFGGVGALAGAATAKTTSQTTFDEKKEECRYSISINLDSISSPIYTMYFGLGSTTCKKVAGILTTIIRRNN